MSSVQDSDGFRGSKWNLKLIIMISLAYDHPSQITVVVLLLKEKIFASTEGAGRLAQSPPCFYSSPGQTNQTLDPERG